MFTLTNYGVVMKKFLFLTLLLVGVPQATSFIQESGKSCAQKLGRFVKLPPKASQKQFQHVPVESVPHYRPVWDPKTFRRIMQDEGMRDSFLSTFFLEELKVFAPISARYLNDGEENFPVHLGVLGDQALLSINVTKASDDLPDYQEKARIDFVRRYVLTKERLSYQSVYGLDLSITTQSVNQPTHNHSLRSDKYRGGVHYCHKTIDAQMARKCGDWGLFVRSSTLTPSHVRLLMSGDPEVFERYFAINSANDGINTN